MSTQVRDGNDDLFAGASLALSDSTRAPVAALCDGTGTATPISPATSGNQTALNTLVGAVSETAPASDTASSGLNGRLQRIAQRITSLIALVPAALTGSGNFKVSLQESNATQAASLNATSDANGITTTARLASSAATTNALRVKNGAGRIYSAQGMNAAAYTVFLVLYDSTTSPPVPGTTTIRKKIPIPAGAVFALDWPIGLSFATGIGYAFTLNAVDADATAIAAGDIIQFNLDYV